MANNIDWKSLIPMAMASMAGAADPRYAGQIGQSGWQGIQAMLQEREQRMKQEQMEKQAKQQEQMMRLYEAREQREQDKYRREAEKEAGLDWIGNQIPNLLSGGIGEQPSFGDIVTRMTSLAKESGMKFTPDMLKAAKEMYDTSAYFPTEEIMFVPGKNGEPVVHWAHTEGKGGRKVFKKTDLSEVPDHARAAVFAGLQEQEPEVMKMVGRALVAKGEKQLGQSIINIANRKLAKENAKFAELSLKNKMFALGILDKKYAVEEQAWKTQHLNEEGMLRTPYMDRLRENIKKPSAQQAAEASEMDAQYHQSILEEYGRMQARYTSTAMSFAPEFSEELQEMADDKIFSMRMGRYENNPDALAVFSGAVQAKKEELLNSGVNNPEVIRKHSRQAGVNAIQNWENEIRRTQPGKLPSEGKRFSDLRPAPVSVKSPKQTEKNILRGLGPPPAADVEEAKRVLRSLKDSVKKSANQAEKEQIDRLQRLLGD